MAEIGALGASRGWESGYLGIVTSILTPLSVAAVHAAVCNARQ